MTQTFIVEARYTDKGLWALRSDNGAFSQCRTLDKVEEEMREAIAYLAQIPENEVQIEVDVLLPQIHDIKEAVSLREEERRIHEQAKTKTQNVVKELIASGLRTRDIGTLLGITHQRASQLAKA